MAWTAAIQCDAALGDGIGCPAEVVTDFAPAGTLAPHFDGLGWAVSVLITPEMREEHGIDDDRERGDFCPDHRERRL